MSQRRFGPGASVVATRLADFAPGSYDAEARTVRATLSAGAPVKRPYGTEVLKIASGAINLDRLSSCGVPLIDSHNIFGVLDGVYGRVDRAWIEGGEFVGLISFDDSEVGRKAEGLVARGIVRGVSIGYRVDEWVITDEDGDVVDPERERLQFDRNYTFTAVRWELLEVSLVSVPADPSAIVRSAGAAGLPADFSAGLQTMFRWASTLPEGSYAFELPGTRAQMNGAARAAHARMATRAAMAARQRFVDGL